MSEAPLMLGVSGLRGIVGQSLTPEVAARFAGSFATWLIDELSEAGGRPVMPLVVAGHDGRIGGQELYNVVTGALQMAGCDVMGLGLAMTPTMGFMTDRGGADAALIVTASHNPQEWNGIKILLRDRGARKGKVSACAPAQGAAERIIERFRAGSVTWRGPEGFGMDWPHPLPVDHAQHVVGLLDARDDLERIRSRRFRVALDTVAGSGMLWSDSFLTELRCRVHELYPQSKYGGEPFPHQPEPVAENLKALCRATKKHKADVGFAQDPDADRLAIVDERGRYLGEEYTLVLAAEALLGEGTKGRRDGGTKRKERVLVTNLSTSRMIDDVAARHGVRVIRTPVGEANVVEVMKREAAAGRDVVLGGEGNGGVIWPRVTYVRDSLSAMGLVLGLMARRKEKLSEIVASMPRYAIEKRKVELSRREDARPAVEKIAAHYGGLGGRTGGTPIPPGSIRVDLQDGVRVDFDDRKAWLHVRPSNTEPIMRLIAEAPTEVEARGVLEEAERVIGGR
jgi:phosphomannomutase